MRFNGLLGVLNGGGLYESASERLMSTFDKLDQKVDIIISTFLSTFIKVDSHISSLASTFEKVDAKDDNINVDFLTDSTRKSTVLYRLFCRLL